jgi:hypothetical protein
VVGRPVVEWNAPIECKSLVLSDTQVLEGLHDLGHEAGQFSLCLHRMLPPYDVVADEGEVITDDDAASECNADREAFVVAVAQPHGVIVVPIRAAQ